MSDEMKWMNHVQVNAKRRPEHEWEQHKAEILESYKTSTLEEVMRLMEERYNFSATKRQYIHRLVDRWGVKKYNKKSTDDGRPHSAGPSSPRDRRSRSKTPLIDNSEKLNSSSKGPLQAKVKNVDGDGCPKTSDVLTAGFRTDQTYQEAAASSNRQTSVIQPAVPSTTSPAGGIHALRVASLPPDEIPHFSRVAAVLAGRRAGTSVPVSRDDRSGFPTQGPSRPPVPFIDSGIRAASRDMDDGQNMHHSGRISCPYRKRNPLRFNVRDYHSCASQPYPDISQLKRHVKVFHKQRPVERCPRCKKGFGTKEEVERHLLVPSNQICDVKALPPPDPEDGINDAIEDCLNGRKANTKIDSWESLWHLLFPDDAQPADSDYYQVKEHFELEQYLLQQLPDSENELRLLLLPMFESFNLTNPPNAGTNTSQYQEATAPLRSATPGPILMTVPSVGITPKRRRTTDDDPE